MDSTALGSGTLQAKRLNETIRHHSTLDEIVRCIYEQLIAPLKK